MGNFEVSISLCTYKCWNYAALIQSKDPTVLENCPGKEILVFRLLAGTLPHQAMILLHCICINMGHHSWGNPNLMGEVFGCAEKSWESKRYTHMIQNQHSWEDKASRNAHQFKTTTKVNYSTDELRRAQCRSTSHCSIWRPPSFSIMANWFPLQQLL